jgi:hypothetical protein
MDADDIMRPHRLEKQYNFMREHHEIVLVSSLVENFRHQKSALVTGNTCAGIT